MRKDKAHVLLWTNRFQIKKRFVTKFEIIHHLICQQESAYVQLSTNILVYSSRLDDSITQKLPGVEINIYVNVNKIEILGYNGYVRIPLET